MAKKENKPAFTREQILKSNTFNAYRDYLSTVLEDGKTYTKEQVKKTIDDFYGNKDTK